MPRASLPAFHSSRLPSTLRCSAGSLPIPCSHTRQSGLLRRLLPCYSYRWSLASCSFRPTSNQVHFTTQPCCTPAKSSAQWVSAGFRSGFSGWKASKSRSQCRSRSDPRSRSVAWSCPACFESSFPAGFLRCIWSASDSRGNSIPACSCRRDRDTPPRCSDVDSARWYTPIVKSKFETNETLRQIGASFHLVAHLALIHFMQSVEHHFHEMVVVDIIHFYRTITLRSHSPLPNYLASSCFIVSTTNMDGKRVN